MHMEVNGKQVEFVDVADMDLDELALLKNVSRMTPVEVEAARNDGDPDAWRGMILVAVRRDDPSITAADLGGLKLFDLIESLDAGDDAGVEKEPDADPPVGPAVGGADGGSTETTPEEPGSQD